MEAPSQLVLPPAEFDARLKADSAFRESIAGVSSFSLTHLIQGKTERGYSVPLFGIMPANRAYTELHPEVYKNVFGKEPTLTLEFELAITRNRAYGQDGALIEHLIGKTEMEYAVLDVVKDLIDRNKGLTRAQLYRTPYTTIFGSEVGRGEYDYIFPTKKALVETILIPNISKGVQVAYGDRVEFARFLKEANAVPDDDCAAELRVPIPADFVKAIIPLGPTEQQVLLKSSET